MDKLINRIPGSRLLISSLPGFVVCDCLRFAIVVFPDHTYLLFLALRTHVESLGKPRDVKKRSQSLAIKRHPPNILYLLSQ